MKPADKAIVKDGERVTNPEQTVSNGCAEPAYGASPRPKPPGVAGERIANVRRQKTVGRPIILTSSLPVFRG